MTRKIQILQLVMAIGFGTISAALSVFALGLAWSKFWQLDIETASMSTLVDRGGEAFQAIIPALLVVLAAVAIRKVVKKET